MRTKRKWLKSIIALSMALLLCFGLVPYGRVGGVFAAGDAYSIAITQAGGETVAEDSKINAAVGTKITLNATFQVEGTEMTALGEDYQFSWWVDGDNASSVSFSASNSLETEITISEAGTYWINAGLYDAAWNKLQTTWFAIEAAAGTEGGEEEEQDEYEIAVAPAEGWTISADGAIEAAAGDEIPLTATIKKNGTIVDQLDEGLAFYWGYTENPSVNVAFSSWSDTTTKVTVSGEGTLSCVAKIELAQDPWTKLKEKEFTIHVDADPDTPDEPVKPDASLKLDFADSAELANWEIVKGEDKGFKIQHENGSLNYTAWDLSDENAQVEFSRTFAAVPAGEYDLYFRQEGSGGDLGLSVKVTSGGQTLASKKLQDTTGWNNWIEETLEAFTLAEAADVTVTFYGTMKKGDWGHLDDIELKSAGEKEEDTSIDAGIFVEKVPGLAEDKDFIHGMDVSSYIAEKDSGVKYYDFNGKELDDQGFFDFLHQECEVNYIRIRIWNDPYYIAPDGTKHGYGGGNSDIDKAIKIGQWATKANMKVLIDFHYSDFWADPGKQQAPKAWADYTVDQKAAAVSSYTKESLKKILDAGVDVGMVQVGNETNNGVAGVKAGSNMADMCKIFTAGCKAVDEIEKTYNREILSVLHFTNPERGFASIAEQLNSNQVPYDVFATSYYPESHGTPSNLTSVLKHVADTYGKKVMVAETGYPYTKEAGDEPGEVDVSGATLDYNVTMQGQSHSIREVINAVESIGEAGLGFMHWEPAWVPVSRCDSTVSEETAQKNWENNKKIWEEMGSGWAASYGGYYDETGDAGKWYGGSAADHKSLFDFSGKAMESILTFKYAKTGAKTTVRVDMVNDPQGIVVHKGDTIPWPETVEVVYNDNSKKQMAVTWDAAQKKEAEKLGVHTVKGIVTVDGKNYTASVEVEMLPKNYLKNGGFEEGNTAWVINNIKVCPDDHDHGTDTNHKHGARITDEANEVGNGHSGTWHLHFWDDYDFEYEVSQTLTVDPGVYLFSGYVQGGDAGADSVFELFANTTVEEEAVNTMVDGYRDFKNPTIQRIAVGTDGKLTVGVYVKAVAGAWGGWDDFVLYKVEDLPMGTTTIGEAVQEIQSVDKNAASTPVVTFDMGSDTKIPPEVLNAMKDQNVKVVFEMDGYTWTINGKDVSNVREKEDIDLGVEVIDGSKVFDTDIRAAADAAAGDKKFLQLHLVHEGEFGFEAALNIHVADPEDKGKAAKLYHYNTQKKALEFEMEAVIDENGNAEFVLSHASDYIVVIDDVSTGKPDTSPNTSPAPMGDNTPILLWTMLLALAIVAVAAGILVRRRVRRESTDNRIN